MKLNNLKNFKFTDYAKYILLAPVVLIIISVIVSTICAVCGVGYFNLDYDYKSSYSFEIKFNATITEGEYEVYKDLVADVLEKNNVKSYRFFELGEGVYSRLEVKALSTKDVATFEKSLKDIQLDLLANLETYGAGQGIDTNVRISVTDYIVEQPMSITSMALFTGISLLVILAVVFLYMFIRFNLMAGVSIILSLLYETAMLTAIISLVRIPVNSTIYIVYMFMYIFTILLNMGVFASIRNTLDADTDKNIDNNSTVLKAVNDTVLPTIIVSALILVATIVLILCGYAFVKFTAMAVAFAIVISIYFVLYANLIIWSKLYSRKKDFVLKKKIERKNKKLEKKSKDEEEKIFV